MEECEMCEGDGFIREICPYCAGSGEGMIPEVTRCSTCKGHGELKSPCDCDTSNEFLQ